VDRPLIRLDLSVSPVQPRRRCSTSRSTTDVADGLRAALRLFRQPLPRRAVTPRPQ